MTVSTPLGGILTGDVATALGGHLFGFTTTGGYGVWAAIGLLSCGAQRRNALHSISTRSLSRHGLSFTRTTTLYWTLCSKGYIAAGVRRSFVKSLAAIRIRSAVQ